MREEDSLRPLAAVAVAIMLLSLMDALVKLLASDYSTWQIVLLRYVFGLCAVTPVFLWRERTLPRRATMRDSALRGLIGMATAFFFFYALSLIPLVKAVALSFSAPLFMILVARIVLREPITLRALAAIGVGSTGVTVMLWQRLVSDGGSSSLIGEVAVLTAAFFYALSVVLTRLHGQRDNAHSLVFTQAVCVTLYALPPGMMAWTALDGRALFLFAIVGILGTAATLLMAWGFSRASAGRLGPVEYTNLIWTSALGFFLFAEIPGPSTIAGAALIISASVLASRRVSRAKATVAG